MSNREPFFARRVTCVVVGMLAVLLSIGSAKAQNASGYTFLVGSGFLCDPDQLGACPAIAKSVIGDSYQISGAGMFNSDGKSVTAAGTFAHKSANGAVLESGVWIVSQLVSFDSYGIGLASLPRANRILGPSQVGAKRSPMPAGPMPTGGLAVFRIRFFAMSVPARTALLEVNCALGSVPTDRSVEGIRLTFDKNGGEFTEEASGRVMFLSMRPEVSAPVKAAQQEPAPQSTETPRN
jgi:hypothetical protein